MAKLSITDANFDAEVLRSDKPVLVDFWATWCGPCRVQGPIVEQLAGEVGDQYKVGALDVDANPVTAQKFNIMSIPTLLVFKKGAVVWQGIGLTQKDALLEGLKKADG